MRALALIALVACGGKSGPVPDRTGGPAITVTVTLWGASPEEVERQVLAPLEQKLAGEPHVATIRSLASPDQGRVVVWFEPGTDKLEAARHANESLKDTATRLPPEGGFPTITIGDPDAPPDLAYVVTSKLRSAGDASDLLEREVAPAIETKVGVRRVAVTGMWSRELQIDIDAARVRAMGVTHDEVIAAVARTEHFSVEEAGNIVVAQLSHVPVPVKDLAHVRLDSAPLATTEPLGIAIWLQTPEQRADVEQAVDEVIRGIPRDVEVTPAPPRAAKPTLAIELRGLDRTELDVIGDSLISDLADIATLTREPPPAKDPQRLLVVDQAVAAKLNVTPESIRAITSAFARAPLRPRITSSEIAVVFGLGDEPLDGILLRATDGAAIPLSMIARLETRPATPQVRIDGYPAVVLTVELLPGGSAGDVQTLLDKHPRIAHDKKSASPRARLVTRKHAR